MHTPARTAKLLSSLLGYSNKGASATEYAVLIALLGAVSLGGLFLAGGDVRDALTMADDGLREGMGSSLEGSNGQGNPGPIASTGEEPEDVLGDPLVMTFSGNARFRPFRLSSQSSSSKFPEPYIDWGPAGAHCETPMPVPFPNQTAQSLLGWRNFEPSDQAARCTLGSGVHTVKVYGPVYHLTGFDQSLLSIEDWGDTGIVSLEGAFQFASNLQSLPAQPPSTLRDMSEIFGRELRGYSDDGLRPTFGAAAPPVPDKISGWNVSQVAEFDRAFLGQSDIPDITGWNVSGARTFAQMFAYSSFNQAIGGWSTGGAEDMSGMFEGAAQFNQPIGGWSMGAVRDIDRMFMNAFMFNQSLSGWNVASVRSADYAFYDARAFNQNIDNWDVGMLESAESMFERAEAFVQSVASWDVDRLRRGAKMFKTSGVSGSFSTWRPDLATQGASSWVEMFMSAEGAKGDLRCWDARAVPTAPSGFFQGAGINNNPRWGQVPLTSCAP